jgi:predicted metal-dependent phosphoesterase TrpH
MVRIEKIMSLFKYETHVHTNQGSACGSNTGTEMARYFKSIGYAGMVVTDHFIGGNTAVPAGLPWEEAMDVFCSGYEDAKKKGDEIGFDVFFGFEYAYRGTEFLIYGLDKTWLKANPQIVGIHLEEALRIFKDAGAFIIHAHPYREAYYIDKIRLMPDYTDAVEVYNAANLKAFNVKAEKYAQLHNIPGVSGGDAHCIIRDSGRKVGGIEVKQRLNSISELTEAIKSGDFTIIK